MKLDSLIIGPVSLDINIDCEGHERRELGGAVVASGYAAGHSGFTAAVLTKANPETADVTARFAESKVQVLERKSSQTCSIQNKYLTPDKEKRICTSVGVCDAFTIEDLKAAAEFEPQVYHFAGLVYGDFTEDLFAETAKRGKIAVDVQCLLRRVMPDRSMAFYDWEKKKEYLPYIDYLKTDAAEAEILTGTDDRRKAARMLHDWGAKEIMITHHSEVLVYDGRVFCTCPIRSRNFSGRTGRGDTTFAGYINSRCYEGIRESLLFATALVSLKMETPGPFRGSRTDVETYIKEFYPEPAVQEDKA